ncbi:MAG TPA: DNA polymerase III subunit beta [Thermoanaerobaculia bacterium]|nr:DNA polymerase III subunit beta [Thermoanaerobaculia bacterium]
MDVRLSRADFFTELVPMQGIVERKTTIPALAHILLTARGESLLLAATDLDVSLTSSVAADIARPGAIAVQAKKLIEIVRALEGDEVHLVEEEPNSLTIKAGKSRFRIRGLPADDFPTLPTVAGGSTAQLSFANLKRMIAKVLFAVSAEESRFQLNGALMKLKGSSLEVVATDGHRLALVETAAAKEGGGEESQEGVLVPRKALQELLRFDSDGDVAYQRGAHHLSFRLGQRELICRILEGTFPDYERVIAKENEYRAVFDRRALLDAVRRVALLTGDRARAIRLSLVEGEITISAANPDLGEAVEEVSCDYDGPEVRLGMNPDYLTEFLAAVETDRVRLELKDENTQAVGYPEQGPDQRYLCVIMPMRI